MIQAVSTESDRPVLDGLYQQLLSRGVQYFIPAARIEQTGHAAESRPDVVFRAAIPSNVVLDWLGRRYAVKLNRTFSDHELKLVRGIASFLSTRYELLFHRKITAQNLPMFGGLIEDRYVSAFLEGRVFDGLEDAAALPDRVSAAIEVLRISALSSYEDKRISTGALLFGSMPDSCHSLPSRPPDALAYSSELTSIRSFHRICDGLQTLMLVDGNGLMVELIDVQEWAQPYSNLELPVPTARRYRTHSQATLCGGHICLVLTPNGEIKIFSEGAQVFSFLDGRWHLTDAAAKYQMWEDAIGDRALAAKLFSAALNLAEHRRGGMFVVLEDARHSKNLVSPLDLLDHEVHESAGGKNHLHYLLRKTRATELSAPVLESIAQIDGSVVLDPEGRLMAFGAILRHRMALDGDEEVGEGGRTAAAISASHFGAILMVSEGGQLSLYRKGRNVWSM
ncbi:MAG TPA: diadenylate cyclase [Bryobacteraceae bacterium]|jgi:hypothetical protein|nr:diadenylate cyclase [Bryobacteraceae bacterium]